MGVKITRKAAGLWEIDGTETQLITADEIDMQIKKIIALANGSAASDAAAYGQIAVKSGTFYWSCTGAHFQPRYNSTDNTEIARDYASIEASEDSIWFFAPVFLPHGATVTKVVVYGNTGAGGETYYLERAALTVNSSDSMGSAGINSEDTSISNATVNNYAYRYYIRTTSLDAGDIIFGARITYTL